MIRPAFLMFYFLKIRLCICHCRLKISRFQIQESKIEKVSLKFCFFNNFLVKGIAIDIYNINFAVIIRVQIERCIWLGMSELVV